MKFLMKKRTLALCLALCLMLSLSGCNKTEVVSSVPSSLSSVAVIKPAKLPRMDGSTALIPFAEALAQEIEGLSKEDAEESILFNTTSSSYLNLANWTTDLILAYPADEDTLETVKGLGVELEYHEIGRDALVFLVNASNAAQGMTTVQIQDIYQGKITSWKEVGGADEEILAFQRPDASGSQALMKKLVMKNLPLKNAPVNLRPHSMFDLVTELSAYRNEGGALGYSVYYYVNSMVANDAFKLLQVDGVAPGNDTIASAQYPFTSPFYAVVRKSSRSDSAERQLLNWILSPEGRKLLEDTGYVPIAQ